VAYLQDRGGQRICMGCIRGYWRQTWNIAAILFVLFSTIGRDGSSSAVSTIPSAATLKSPPIPQR
jgi:hypothetical protein